MAKILKIIVSNKATLVLLLIYAASMAYATFYENDFGTNAVRLIVYDSLWFEIIQWLLMINFIANIRRYKLFRKEKWSLLVFHLAFIVILAGAFVTRYISYEGSMRIRENSSSNTIISMYRYLTVDYEQEGQKERWQQRVKASTAVQPKLQLDEAGFTVKTTRFVPDAVEALVKGDSTNEVLEVVVTDQGMRNDLYLESGKSIRLGNGTITFNAPVEGGINIQTSGDTLLIETPDSLSFFQMATQRTGIVEPSKLEKLMFRTLYQKSGMAFVFSQYHKGKRVDFVPAPDKDMASQAADLLFVEVSDGENSHEVIFASIDGVYTEPKMVNAGGQMIKLNYGPKLIDLPFSIYLRDFQLERYPGSTSPSSYASEVTVNPESGEPFDYRIFMNNVLDHDGYRFFQASYDTDEKGTILSVNRDGIGTNITYLGYTLLFLGMFWTLFAKHSRFRTVLDRLNKLQAKKLASILLLMIFSIGARAESTFVIDSMHIISVDHAKKFGQLLVQDMDGRIKPLNTLTSELTRKLMRSTALKTKTITGEKLNGDQLFLSLSIDPIYWRDVPMIKVDQHKGEPILDLLEKPNRDYLAFSDLIDQKGNYLLYEWAEQSNRKKPAERNELDKEIIKVDERFNILYQALDGYYLKVFPKKNDPGNQWFDYRIANAGFESEDSLFVASIIPIYYRSVWMAQKSGSDEDWEQADQNLGYIATYQDVLGKEVSPSEGRRKGELLYNELNLFTKLFPIYWMLGLVALVLSILKVFYNKSKFIKVSLWVLVGAISLAFLAQTFNIILRWYAGDYPPWSNGYEMIILVSWFLMLFGFVFLKKSDFVLPLACLFTGTLLFVSFLDWLNPEITNLVPVLKSYWLKIHVAIIVGSYAPLALSALLGLLVLIFMMLPDQKKVKIPIEEMTYINELSMTIGLFMLTIGTFLGGVWANESWGRYWGWDPKETWALISVIVYAIVVHLRLVPSLGTKYIFNTASLFAFYSILMTSYGVNYYLSGLHSYAKGDPVPIPSFVYWVSAILIAIAVGAYFAQKKYAKV
ncbi:cytochrome c biogenesis protein [Reichenbachiella versicolor]|uniref:cytochrome c biogenesis protein n=1 Tax=Reichenbachiella versicolor TaxID=1821036 RepID=UPI000D6E2CCE|nr:cytochrome c biogenesis protein CcsA [Reichenbachiella versicolor]